MTWRWTLQRHLTALQSRPQWFSRCWYLTSVITKVEGLQWQKGFNEHLGIILNGKWCWLNVLTNTESCVVFLDAKAISGSGTRILAPGMVLQYLKAISKPILSHSKIMKIKQLFLHRPCQCFQKIWRLSWNILMEQRQDRLCQRLVGSILKPFCQQLHSLDKVCCMNGFDHILLPNQLGLNFRNDELINLQYWHINPSNKKWAW